jgi:hypothetical protein
MVQRARRGADYVVLVEERAGFLRELPVWMCDAAACAAMTFGPPAVSIGALQALSALLMDRSANHRSGASSGSPVTEDLAGAKSHDSSPDPTRAEDEPPPPPIETDATLLLQALADLLLEAPRPGGLLEARRRGLRRRRRCVEASRLARNGPTGTTSSTCAHSPEPW